MTSRSRTSLPYGERLARAAAKLSPREYRVLVLSARQKCDNREIARRLGLKQRTVERLLARAIAKFDRALSDK